MLRTEDTILGENYPTSKTQQSKSSNSTSNPKTQRQRSFHTSARAENVFGGGRPVGLYGRDMDGDALDLDAPTADFEKIGTQLYPLFCLSVHEHAWLSAGYGIWGKEEYLKRFWTVLDWGKVSNAFNIYAPRRSG